MILKEGKLPASGKKFSRMRRDMSTYKIFFDYFLPCVVGKSIWAAQCCSKAPSKITTTSDEAFAHLLLENSWDAWVAEEEGGEHVHCIWTEDSLAARKYCGWSEEGLERMNELYRKVKLDREDCVVTERAYTKEKKDASDRHLIMLELII